MQKFFSDADELVTFLKSSAIRGAFVLHGNSYNNFSLKMLLDESGVRIVHFTEFGVNPRYEEVYNAAASFRVSNTDVIIAVGGGSAIDTAKYIKLNNPSIPLAVVPTTAGSGSESTSFAVYYQNGEKQSIMDNSILPDYVMLMPTVLSSLSLAQKHCTLADALCQAIEAWWSVNATDESREYSRQAIAKLLPHADAYFDNDSATFDTVMQGANYAGRAINVAKTTAAHAMSYKITSIFNLPHGYTVALCLPAVWEFMNQVVLPDSSLEQLLEQIAAALGCECLKEAPGMLKKLFKSWGIIPPGEVTQAQLEELSTTINLERLKNFPVVIDAKTARRLYENILGER